MQKKFLRNSTFGSLFPATSPKAQIKNTGVTFILDYNFWNDIRELTSNQLLEDLVKNLVFLYAENFNTQRHSTNENLERKS